MPTVLIVDDTAVDRRLAGGLLENTPNIEVCYAQNGNDALLQLGVALPDLVVTDLQMPDLDGLELVTTIGEKYPEVPVVLMTAHGSENIAAQALASGAASFVPKAELAENLLETVMHILMMAETDARYKKLVSCATKTDFEFALQNDPAIIDPLIDMLQQVAVSQGLLSSNSRVQMSVALEHALHNAMVRGNLEIGRDDYPVVNAAVIKKRSADKPYCDRTVYFRALITPEAAKFTIRDMGPGFDTSTIPAASDPESFRDGRGRGLVLIQTFMDEVEFDASGREMKLTKYRTDAPGKPR
jgi:CheY-like chemotaxis protein